MIALRKTFLKGSIAVLLIITASAVYAGGSRDRYGYGPGMMGGGYGYGMMGGGYGPGMMVSGWDATQGNTPEELGLERISLEDARKRVSAYLDSYGYKNLLIDEIMEFDQNFYALIKEKDTGKSAFELLVDPYRGYVGPEPGPNMMWNVKYGHMSWTSQAPDTMPVSVAKARESAQNYLDKIGKGYSVEEKPDEFYGYFTAHILKGDQILGMLSINGYTGQVWFHSWHGTFRSMDKED
jgi:hypothetical protein